MTQLYRGGSTARWRAAALAATLAACAVLLLAHFDVDAGLRAGEELRESSPESAIEDFSHSSRGGWEDRAMYGGSLVDPAAPPDPEERYELQHSASGQLDLDGVLATVDQDMALVARDDWTSDIVAKEQLQLEKPSGDEFAEPMMLLQEDDGLEVEDDVQEDRQEEKVDQRTNEALVKAQKVLNMADELDEEYSGPSSHVQKDDATIEKQAEKDLNGNIEELQQAKQQAEKDLTSDEPTQHAAAFREKRAARMTVQKQSRARKQSKVQKSRVPLLDELESPKIRDSSERSHKLHKTIKMQAQAQVKLKSVFGSSMKAVDGEGKAKESLAKSRISRAKDQNTARIKKEAKELHAKAGTNTAAVTRVEMVKNQIVGKEKGVEKQTGNSVLHAEAHFLNSTLYDEFKTIAHDSHAMNALPPKFARWITGYVAGQNEWLPGTKGKPYDEALKRQEMKHVNHVHDKVQGLIKKLSKMKQNQAINAAKAKRNGQQSSANSNLAHVQIDDSSKLVAAKYPAAIRARLRQVQQEMVQKSVQKTRGARMAAMKKEAAKASAKVASDQGKIAVVQKKLQDTTERLLHKKNIEQEQKGRSDRMLQLSSAQASGLRQKWKLVEEQVQQLELQQEDLANAVAKQQQTLELRA